MPQSRADAGAGGGGSGGLYGGGTGGAAGGGGSQSGGGGNQGTGGSQGTGGTGGAPSLDDLLQECVDEVNRYRASAGLPPLRRSAELEASAAEAAKYDGTAHGIHQHATQVGLAPARGENEIPWWSIQQFGSIAEIIRQGLAAMWAEGAGGVHHRNMVGNYTEMGCGIYENGDEATVVQHFR